MQKKCIQFSHNTVVEVKEIKISDIEEFDSVDVIEVLVKVGDEISIDQPLITVESEKAMMDYPSPHAGVVEEIIVREGNKVSEGDVLLKLKTELDKTVQNETITSEDPKNEVIEQSQSKVVEKVQTVPARKQQAISNSSYASPGTHKYARELGVNLNNVQGSGRQQRIVIEDVQQHVRQNLNSSAMHNSVSSKPLDFSSYGKTHAQDLSKIQKLTAQNMQNAWQSIPHVTHFDQADVTQLELHRKKLAEELKNKDIKLTPLAFVVKALVLCLKKFPLFNTSIDLTTQQLIYKEFFHIGIAVDTEYGLFVPVIRDVNKKTLEQIAIELIEVSTLARQRKLTPKHMGGASMTISSLGNLGGQAFTPIINPPEVAILGLSEMLVNEAKSESEINYRKLLPLSLSYDHRVINGADAARFCSYLKNVLEDIWKLIL